MITIQWLPNANTQTPAGSISGYYAYMDDGLNGQFEMIHNGGKLPSTVSASKSGLITGLPYRFYVVAENVIGKSIPSSITTIYSCTAPSGLDRPVKGSVTQTTVQLFWNAPVDDGGCLITGYSILRDDGNNGNFVEVHAATVNGKPNLKTFVVTDLPASPVGKTVKFKIVAHNMATYSVTSFSTPVVIAAPPTSPASAPVSDFSVTNQNLIKVVYAAPSSDGGSPILNYEIQMDDGLGSGFRTIAGGDSQIHLYTFFQAQTISQGR